MKIVVGTKNSKKVAAVKGVFGEILSIENLDIQAYDASSNVPEAPFNEETYAGALNRANECSRRFMADYCVGVESGLVERYGNFFEEAWAVVIPKDNQPLIGYSSGLLVPKIVVQRMKQGEKHNQIMEQLDALYNLPKENRDTWSRYTGGNISRELSIIEALRNAVVQLAPSERNLYKM